MIHVLGVHDGHTATAALLRDGEIVACVSEERLTGVKNQAGMPVRAVALVLRMAGITPAELDRVVLTSRFLPPLHGTDAAGGAATTYGLARRAKRAAYRLPAPVYETVYRAASRGFYGRSTRARTEALRACLPGLRVPVVSMDHHEAHAAAAFHASGFDRPTLVLTLDGEGDGASGSVWIYGNGEPRCLDRISSRDSLGNLYTHVTVHLGMKATEHEYKVMGLAPYAGEDGVGRAWPAFADLVRVEGTRIRTSIHSHRFGEVLHERLARLRFDWIAGAVQRLTERTMVAWVKNAIAATDIRRVAFGGGVFMNVKANMLLNELPDVEDAFFMPSGGDESLPIGACYDGYVAECRERGVPAKPRALGPLYLGDAFDDEAVEEAFRRLDVAKEFDVAHHKDSATAVGELVARGEIVARVAGRMEWGARALGNRSILADASDPRSVKTINAMIKARDFWMPFAPSILAERAADYMLGPRADHATYMAVAYRSTPIAEKHLASAMHPYDLTIRPQVVDRRSNPEYHRILTTYEAATGRGGLLNTSFNLHGFPIVRGPQEAIHVFRHSGLRHVAVGDHLVSKR